MLYQHEDRRPLEERENIFPDKIPKKPGFSPRHMQRYAEKKLPRSLVNIECNHVLRTEYEGRAHGRPLLSHALWMETGKHDFPDSSESGLDMNSNTWRNFAVKHASSDVNKSNFHSPREKDQNRISNSLAALYPIAIPSPSKLKKHTYSRYLTEVPSLIQDEKLRQSIIKSVDDDLYEFKRWRLRSEMRNPPLDKAGRILPPRHYRHYEHRELPADFASPCSDGEEEHLSYVDTLGQKIPYKKYRSYYYLPPRLTLQRNTPQYQDTLRQIGHRLREKHSALTRGVKVHTYPV